MNYLLYFFQICILQYTAAQVITLGGRNFIPSLNNQNCANLPIAANFANNAGLLANIGQTGQLTNNILAQDIVNANLLNNAACGLANNNIGLASNIGVPSNIASESVVYNNAVPAYANVVQPPREYGIEFSSGALQVGGNVEVNGRMPFNANVAVSGSVPTQGLGAVNYSCDQLGVEES